MSELQDKDTARRVWSRLLQEWEFLGDGDPLSWRKSCGMITFYITQINEGNVVDFELAIHGGDDEIILEQKLIALNFEDAAKQSDILIAEFLVIGADVMKTDEIRIKQVFVESNIVKAVGIDGRLYILDSYNTWRPISMKLAPTAW